MVGVVMTVHNRPSATKMSFFCLQRTEWPIDAFVVIIDDGSDEQTMKLCMDLKLPVTVHHLRNYKAQGVQRALLQGISFAFDTGATIVTNLDNDVVLRKEWLKTLVNAKQRHKGHIVTGFNCFTRNRDGSERHKVVSRHEGYNLKESVGGINMVVEYAQWRDYMQPALKRSVDKGGNWDHLTCIASMQAGYPIVCVSPSVVQHQEVRSSMGHHEQPDVATDFVALDLPDVTLMAVTGTELRETLIAADISCKDVRFGAVKVLSHLPSDDKRVVPIKPILSKEAYNEFVVRDLWRYVDTPYLLIFQADGYLLNWRAWDDTWRQYDYIGAVWNWYDKDRVGNGGFSFRSKKLMKALAEDEVIMESYPEDHQICRVYKRYMEKKGFKWASEEVANRFSIEAHGVKFPGNVYSGQFGFHGWNVSFAGADIRDVPVRKRAVGNSVPRLVMEKRLLRQQNMRKR